VNDKILSGSNLDELCVVANNHITIKRRIRILFEKEFTSEQIEERKQNLNKIYNNGNNVKKLIKLIND
jgi:hypothetical protein